MWERVRRRVLDAQNWRCQICKRYGNEVDHKIPMHKGGAAWDPDNLQCLCRSCHIAKTQKENCPALRNPDAAKWKALVNQLV